MLTSRHSRLPHVLLQDWLVLPIIYTNFKEVKFGVISVSNESMSKVMILKGWC